MKVINENILSTGDDDGCVKVSSSYEIGESETVVMV